VPCFICSAKAGFNFSFSFHHTAANHTIASVCVALQDRDDTRLLRAASCFWERRPCAEQRRNENGRKTKTTEEEEEEGWPGMAASIAAIEEEGETERARDRNTQYTIQLAWPFIVGIWFADWPLSWPAGVGLGGAIVVCVWLLLRGLT